MSDRRERPGTPDLRYQSFWGRSASGEHLVSRPIIVDGLRKSRVVIELEPRIRTDGGRLVDNSYRAVERASHQFIENFTLEQIVMATVALQVHMRQFKEHIERKRSLQARWTDLAWRTKRIRTEDEHLSFQEERLAYRRADVGNGPAEESSLGQLLALEEEEIEQRREAWLVEKSRVQALWPELEREDRLLAGSAPLLEQTEDLRYPYALTLLAPGPTSRRGRSLASAMQTLVEALQKPLSRTDQALLEIALRRCVRASAPQAELHDAEGWEKERIRETEKEFAREFTWAWPLLGAARSTRGARAPDSTSR